MRIAIIGGGISGLTAAYYLHQEHDVTVFEAADRVGGHTATVDVVYNGQTLAIDTGFIVYNEATYPNFIRLLETLGVASQPTTMGFSVSCQATGLEYSGGSLGSLFAQRRNLLSPYFLKLVRDILRFNKASVRDLDRGKIAADETLGDYLNKHGYSAGFVSHYLAPMAAAIWSSETGTVLDFPVQFFIRFFKNHGLLQIRDRPQWRTIVGGSREYIAPLTLSFREAIRTSCPVISVSRHDDGVTVTSEQHGAEEFDQCVLATHSDQALALLADSNALEQDLLSVIPYCNSDVVLHTDTRLLPTIESTWSSWNYSIAETSMDSPQNLPIVTYDMNILQCLDGHHDVADTFCVTLNNSAAIDPEKIIGEYRYAHPQFSVAGIAAQARWGEINGARRTWFCGAYWHNGFHEDGVVSALRVARGLGIDC